MTWFKVDDGFAAHRKLETLETDPVLHALAVAAWTLLGADCAARLTDGAVTPQRLARVLPWPAKLREKAADALVSCGLWERVGDAWQFHDWNHYQPTRESVEHQRSKARDRKRTHDEKMRGGNAATNVGGNVGGNAVGNGVPNAAVTESRTGPSVPSRPDPSRESESGPPRPAETPFAANLATLWTRWAKSYGRARGQIAGDDSPKAKAEICRVLTEHAADRGETFERVADAVLERYWRDPWPRDHKNRASLQNLLGQLAGILDEPGAHGAPDRDPPDYDPAKHGPPKDSRNDAAWNAHLDRAGGIS